MENSKPKHTIKQWCQTDPVTHTDPNQVCSCLVGMKACSHSSPLLDQFDTTAIKGLETDRNMRHANNGRTKTRGKGET